MEDFGAVELLHQEGYHFSSPQLCLTAGSSAHPQINHTVCSCFPPQAVHSLFCMHPRESCVSILPCWPVIPIYWWQRDTAKTWSPFGLPYFLLQFPRNLPWWGVTVHICAGGLGAALLVCSSPLFGCLLTSSCSLRMRGGVGVVAGDSSHSAVSTRGKWLSRGQDWSWIRLQSSDERMPESGEGIPQNSTGFYPHLFTAGLSSEQCWTLAGPGQYNRYNRSVGQWFLSFFFSLIFIYLASLGLRWGTWDLWLLHVHC